MALREVSKLCMDQYFVFSLEELLENKSRERWGRKQLTELKTIIDDHARDQRETLSSTIIKNLNTLKKNDS